MAAKDHYGTLGILPQSGIQDIKRAYRRLAMLYHPDKAPDDPQAAARFREIREAYSTLSDPILREKYHHERWFTRAAGKQYAAPPPLTPYAILLKAVELDRYMSRQDPFRTDREGLLAYMKNVLNTEALEILLHNNDISLNNRIAALFLHAGRILEYQQVAEFAPALQQLAPDKTKEIQHWIRSRRHEMIWNGMKGWAVLLMAILLSWCIYLLARR